MGRIVKVDWNELKRISNKCGSFATEIDNIISLLRQNFNSVNECWKGTDTNNYIKNCEVFLTQLSNESIYLKNWQSYLSSASEKYLENVEQGSSKIIDVEDYLK